MQYFLFVHCNDGYTNAPQIYVIPTSASLLVVEMDRELLHV